MNKLMGKNDLKRIRTMIRLLGLHNYDNILFESDSDSITVIELKDPRGELKELVFERLRECQMNNKTISDHVWSEDSLIRRCIIHFYQNEFKNRQSQMRRMMDFCNTLTRDKIPESRKIYVASEKFNSETINRIHSCYNNMLITNKHSNSFREEFISLVRSSVRVDVNEFIGQKEYIDLVQNGYVIDSPCTPQSYFTLLYEEMLYESIQ